LRKYTSFTGIAMPLRRGDVDTDQILPSEFMKRITKTGYADALFHSWRRDDDFILNQPRYSEAQVLVAGPNFGAGSSREHAVWALRDYGFLAVFSSRIADIFRGNAGKQGLLAATMSDTDIERVWAILDADPDARMRVDLASRICELKGELFHFEVDDHTRARLLDGIDDIDATLRSAAIIDDFERRRPAWMPRTLPIRASNEAADARSHISTPAGKESSN